MTSNAKSKVPRLLWVAARALDQINLIKTLVCA